MTLLDAHLRPAARLPVPVPPTAIQFAPDGASLFLALSSPTAPTVARLGRAGRAGAWQEGTALDGEGRRLRIAPDGLLAVVAVAGPLGGLALVHAPTLRLQGAMARCDARDVVLTPSADRALLICGEGQVTEVDL
ncbi:MAG TPA: hypothetical protein VD793_08355, partial [Gemmatimonadales bacterium]|nr:hypothetical protein [Gemmatimonadales bacterium]